MKNSREVTIYDVAKALNISPSTVSRGLKNHPHIRKETVKRIIAAADQMGYQRNNFASSLRLKHTNTLGLIVPKLNSYFMSTVIAGIEKITNENGYGLIISTSQESALQEISNVKTLFNSRVDGLMVSLAFDTRDLGHFNLLLNRNIPVIFFDRVSQCPGCMSVVIDNFKAGNEVTSHLISQGCRRIVHIGGNMLRNVYSERFGGYKKALRSAGIPLDKNLVIVGDLSSQWAAGVAAKILKMKSLPDGVFAANDTSAVALIIELQKAGIRIPGDICVAGFNNEPVSQVIKPNLTTVNYPAEEIGEIVAGSLIRNLRNKKSQQLKTIVLDHKLIVRESSLRIVQGAEQRVQGRGLRTLNQPSLKLRPAKP
jgi:LacI family transcriptional regulator